MRSTENSFVKFSNVSSPMSTIAPHDQLQSREMIPNGSLKKISVRTPLKLLDNSLSSSFRVKVDRRSASSELYHIIEFSYIHYLIANLFNSLPGVY